MNIENNLLNAIRWCELCQSRPSDGELTVIVDEEEMIKQACTICVIEIPQEDWL